MSASTTSRRLLPVFSILVLALSLQPAVSAQTQEPAPHLSAMRLDASLIQEFVQVIYFADGGRYQFREYSTCSYEFLQNPVVAIEDGLVRVSAEYYRRRATAGLGGCVGGPGVNTVVSATARLSGNGSAIAIEVLEATTATMPELTSVILSLAGVTVPMTHDFDLMAAMNRILQDTQPFGIAALEVHEVLTEDDSVLLRMTMRMGIW